MACFEILFISFESPASSFDMALGRQTLFRLKAFFLEFHALDGQYCTKTTSEDVICYCLLVSGVALLIHCDGQGLHYFDAMQRGSLNFETHHMFFSVQG